MTADFILTNPTEAELGPTPLGFTIEAVRNVADLYDFKRLFVEIYEIPGLIAICDATSNKRREEMPNGSNHQYHPN